MRMRRRRGQKRESGEGAPEEMASGVAHEDRRWMKIEKQKADRHADEREATNRDRRGHCFTLRSRKRKQECGCNCGDAGGESVDVIEKIERVCDRRDPRERDDRIDDRKPG